MLKKQLNLEQLIKKLKLCNPFKHIMFSSYEYPCTVGRYTGKLDEVGGLAISDYKQYNGYDTHCTTKTPTQLPKVPVCKDLINMLYLCVDKKFSWTTSLSNPPNFIIIDNFEAYITKSDLMYYTSQKKEYIIVDVVEECNKVILVVI